MDRRREKIVCFLRSSKYTIADEIIPSYGLLDVRCAICHSEHASRNGNRRDNDRHNRRTRYANKRSSSNRYGASNRSCDALEKGS